MKTLKAFFNESILPKINLTSYNSLLRERTRSWHLQQRIDQQNQHLSTLSAQIDKHENAIEQLTAQIDKSNAILASQEILINQQSSVLKLLADQASEIYRLCEINQQTKPVEALKTSILQELISVNWNLIDAVDPLRYKDYENVCRICGHRSKIDEMAVKISQCVFGGGRLERYVCPGCGVIFGPLKTLLLTSSQLGADYNRHYQVYSEGDSTDKEIKTFLSLNPTKTGVYLNYGSGSWSKTIEILRGEGYDIYGYDPYAPSKNTYTLNWDQVKNIKFNGIFTHNLLEHIQDPVPFIKSMQLLLRDKNSLMAHATPCYEYRFEFTRFHLYFFTGKSVDELCSRCGLTVSHIDRDPSNDYINYVYKQIPEG